MLFAHSSFLHEGTLHVVGLAAELNEPAVVHDSVDVGGYLVFAERCSPAAELQAGGDDHTLLLVGVRKDLEEHPRADRVQGQKLELVDHKQVGSADLRRI